MPEKPVDWMENSPINTGKIFVIFLAFVWQCCLMTFKDDSNCQPEKTISGLPLVDSLPFWYVHTWRRLLLWTFSITKKTTSPDVGPCLPMWNAMLPNSISSETKNCSRLSQDLKNWWFIEAVQISEDLSWFLVFSFLLAARTKSWAVSGRIGSDQRSAFCKMSSLSSQLDTQAFKISWAWPRISDHFVRLPSPNTNLIQALDESKSKFEFGHDSPSIDNNLFTRSFSRTSTLMYIESNDRKVCSSWPIFPFSLAWMICWPNTESFTIFWVAGSKAKFE